MTNENRPSLVALPEAFTITDTIGGAPVMVTTPSKLPLKGTCSPADAVEAYPSTVKVASARLAAERWCFELERFMVSVLLVLVRDTMEGHRSQRANRAPGRCRAGECPSSRLGLTGRFFQVLFSTTSAACFNE